MSWIIGPDLSAVESAKAVSLTIEASATGSCHVDKNKPVRMATRMGAIPATLVVGFVVYRRVGKKSHGTETSRVITFLGHAISPNAHSHLFTADGRHKDMCHEPVSILSSIHSYVK